MPTPPGAADALPEGEDGDARDDESPPLRSSRFTRSRYVWGSVLGLLLLALALRDVNWGEFRSQLCHADLPLVGAAILAAAAQLLVRTWRWRLLLTSPPPTPDLLWALLVSGLINNVLPARSGDVVRGFLLRRHGLRPATVLGSILAERLLDVLLTLCLLGVSLWLIPLPDWIQSAGLASLALLLVMGVAIILASRFREVVFDHFPRRLPAALAARVRDSVSLFLTEVAVAARPRALPALLISTLALAATLLVAIWLCLRAVGLHLPLGASVVVAVFLSFALMIPGAPSNVGAVQLACVLALGLYGVADTTALIFSLVFHVSQWLPVTVPGLLCVWLGVGHPRPRPV